MIYFDNNATTKTHPEVRRAVLLAMEEAFANPSSAHPSGDASRAMLRKTRECLGQLMGCRSEEIVFTSGGTEANNTILMSLLHQQKPVHLITSTVEHSSVLKAAEFLEERGVVLTALPVDSSGLICLSSLEEVLDQSPSMVSIQWANNETGVCQPIRAIGEMCKEKGVIFHSDISQALGKEEFRLDDICLDFATFSAHKFHGPPGTGGMFVRSRKFLAPLLHGGLQEGGVRAGTENLPGIVGMGEAARLRMEKLRPDIGQMKALRDHFEESILSRVAGSSINGIEAKRLENTSNVKFEGIDGQALVAQLGQLGVMCSQSSACTNRRPEPSYVLRAMGMGEEEAYSCVRFSFSVNNTLEEVDEAINHISNVCAKQRMFFL